MLEKRTQLAAAVESVEGAAETLDAGDVVLADNITFTPSIDMDERSEMSASLSPFAAVPGKRSATLEFDMDLKGSGAAGTAPALGVLLQGSGLDETISAGTSVTYLPASSSIPSLTLAAYMDGVIHKLWGARGTMRVSLEQGRFGRVHFTFTGADFSVTDGALLSPTYESTTPPAFLSASLTIDSYSAMIGKLEIDLGNEITLRSDVNQSSGHKSAIITARKPTLSMDPEKILVATYDWYGKWRSGNQGALSTELGSVAGNIITITAPKVQYSRVAEASNAGLRTLGIDGLLGRDSGDDELSIALT